MATRAHVILPEELLEEVDRVAGKRKRSRFVEDAIRDKLVREKQAIALRESVGALDLTKYPEWETPEKISEWVRAIRRGDEARLSRPLGTSEE